MRVKNRRMGLWLVACYMLQSMLFSFTASAETEKGIVHDPVTSVATGERVKLSASVADDAGVELVRAYFKHETGANYLFVNLSSTDGVNYSGTLPASSIANSTMNYLLLVKNKANQVYKSQVFTLPIKAGTAVVASQAPIKVFTELSEAPKAIAGFSDNLTMDVAESGAKYGAVTGLYGSGNATAATAATSATNAGTVTATTTSTNVAAGTGVGSSASGSGAAASTATTTTATAATTTAAVSTTTIVAGTAVAAGAAVAASGGSDDDDDGGEGTIDYSGVYTVELEGGLTDDIAGDCSANAAVRFSNVKRKQTAMYWVRKIYNYKYIVMII